MPALRAPRADNRLPQILDAAARLLRTQGFQGTSVRDIVRDVDMLDGTPVFDIKPYVAYTDAIVDARAGWLEDSGDARAAVDPVARWQVDWSALAAEQAAWVEQQTQLPLRARAEATLSLGPEPHPYRRIRRDRDSGVLAVKEWRLSFTVVGRCVQIGAVQSGYGPSQLAGSDPRVVHREAHQVFRELWPT